MGQLNHRIDQQYRTICGETNTGAIVTYGRGKKRLVTLDCLSVDVASMVKEMGKKGISVKDEPGLSVVRLFGPGVGDEKVGNGVQQ